MARGSPRRSVTRRRFHLGSEEHKVVGVYLLPFANISDMGTSGQMFGHVVVISSIWLEFFSSSCMFLFDWCMAN
ncbi:hypothetical protein F2Q70_00016413 [Brassica cretica]|uniref:Uncharacterized protein n=1 Tax=Brassica cretica TaxID=69181 RepID=A0A8S9I1V1_BRACR|nr:hypothetical protein F2Q70_00016413 [Brassica cretica]